ncbi:MAG TPA: Flp pilus assembly protein CpaB [Candidatus Elarobacter sp.]|jgi:pilus assembly protein CpaB|nr:Flp pilus assembly protein CpaB [Candidatus Elarobacter sp.]
MKMPPRTTLVIAAVIAAATGFITLNYVSSVSRSEAAQAEPQARILVAKEDIPARVTIDVSMLKRVSRPISQVEPGAVVEANRAVGLISLVSMPAGSTITASRIGRPQSIALAVVLKRGMRAVSIGIDRVKAVGGLIQPGDRVDVIAVPPRVADETPQGRTIIYGALVLASGTQMEVTSQPAAQPAQPAQQDAANLTTVTLAVTPAQADVLASADVNATLRLALRSPQDPVGSVAPERFVLPVAAAPRVPVTPVAPPITLVAPPAAAPPAAAPPQRPAPAAVRSKPAPRSGPEIIEEHASTPKAGS